MDDEIALRSAGELAAGLKAKEFSSRELLDVYLDRCERLNPKLNAVVTFDEARARSAAYAADEALARGAAYGPLHGLPITVKDAIATEGLRSTGGATELARHVPESDAPAVGRLRAAGAIVFGKTNVPRWSGDIQTHNELFGTTVNPWNEACTPGGSSGGAAAAVSAGLTSFELGTDIGGSVRFPSHFCGVFGHKPSYGVVSQLGYLDHVDGGTTDADINVFGPIARSATDLGLLLAVLAGPDPDRAAAWSIALPQSRVVTLDGLRVAAWLDDPACRVEKAYSTAMRGLADALSMAGARVTEVRPPVDPAAQYAVFSALVGAAIAPAMPRELATRMAGGHLDWLALDRERARLRREWATWFAGYDVLLAPVGLSGAFEHDQSGNIAKRTMTIDGVERSHMDFTFWTGMFGVIGVPSTVVPIGFDRRGLPLGIQIVAPFLQDRTSIRVAELMVDEGLVRYTPPPVATAL
ncbi:MAG: amidase family protein [Acidimicrobiia bacterium]